jgi:hypothetical protein
LEWNAGGSLLPWSDEDFFKKFLHPPDEGHSPFVSFGAMNDIENNPPPTEPARTKKEESPSTIPDAATFERLADMLARDLRRAHTAEISDAAKTHFHSDNPDIGCADHDRRGTALLEELGKRHTREQFTFRASIGKLRSYYANARDRADENRPSRAPSGQEKSFDPGRSR